MAEYNNITGQSVSVIRPGQMYHYRYKPEGNIDYYDIFPLVFVVKKTARLFEAINFHYLDLERRLKLFELMKPYFTENVIDASTKLDHVDFKRVTLGLRTYRDARVSYRRYILNNIKSKIIRVVPTNWLNSIKKENHKFVTKKGGKFLAKRVWKHTLIESRK